MKLQNNLETLSSQDRVDLQMAAAATILLWAAMPETRPGKYLD